MQLETAAFEIAVDAGAPLGQYVLIIMEQREIVDVPDVRRAQNFRHPMVETVQIQVGEELARFLQNSPGVPDFSS